MMLKIEHAFAVAVFALMLSIHYAHAIPMFDRTMIKASKKIEPADQNLAELMLNLEIYADSKNPNLYYFVPPFRISQKDQGAAAPFYNIDAVKNFGEAQALLNERDAVRERYYDDLIMDLERYIQIDKKNVDDSRRDLKEAIADGIPEIIRGCIKILEMDENAFAGHVESLEQARKDKKNKIPPSNEVGRAQLEMARTKLVFTGFPVPPLRMAIENLLSDIQTTMMDVSSSYGGYLGVHAYGGFTQEQLEGLRRFRAKYAPDVQLILLPIEDLTFFSLSETMNQKMSRLFGSNFVFRQIRGSGDYLGATVVLDLSVGGANALAAHLSPFILPVGVKATIKQTTEPTRAKVYCDFSSLVNRVEGQNIRRNSRILSNNLVTKMQTDAANNGNCTIDVLEGDLTIAKHKIMDMLNVKLAQMNIFRTTVSVKEKEIYYRSILEKSPVVAGRGLKIISRLIDDKPDYVDTWVRNRMDPFEWEELANSLAQGSQSFWEAPFTQINDETKTKFTLDISVEGHEKITRDLPTNLCLVYNFERRAYDRCTELEDQNAKGMTESFAEAMGSPECNGATNSLLCGANRDKAGMTAGKDRSAVSNDDANLPRRF